MAASQDRRLARILAAQRVEEAHQREHDRATARVEAERVAAAYRERQARREAESAHA